MIIHRLRGGSGIYLKVKGIEDIFDNTTVAKVCKQAVKTWKES